MTITKTTEFKNSSADMYRSSLPRDFAALSSDQDAWYYGCWASAERRVLFFYAEGDCTTIECTTDDEFASAVRGWHSWTNKMGYDGAIRLRTLDNEEAWYSMGLKDLITANWAHGRINLAVEL